jgi:hypothetical protein
MIEKDVEVLGYIEKRRRLAMMLIGHGAILELHGATFRKEGDAHHVGARWLAKVDGRLRILL